MPVRPKMTMRTIAAVAVLLIAGIFLTPIADEALEYAVLPQAVFSANFSGANAETLGAINLSSGTFEIGVGDTKPLNYSVDGTRGALGVDWTSSDPAVAGVAPGGAVTAVAEGTCVLTGVSYGGHVAEARVRVYPAPTVLIVSPSSVKLGRGEFYAPTPVISAGSRTSYAYQSSDSSVASVDAGGVVNAKKRGSATITVRTHNGLVDKLTVTVSKAPGFVAFKLEKIIAFTGEAVKVPVKLSADSASVISYSSSDPEIARVDSTGRVTGVSAGTAVISAETFNGKSAECPVVVYDPPERISAPGQIEAVAGVPMPLTVWAVTASGERYGGDMDVDIADPDIIAVTDGVLFPLKRGDTYITFTAHRVSLRVPVTVARYGDAYATLIAAHRGGRGNGTENTLAAITGAVSQGTDLIEIDVRRTADGEIVLMHDSTVTRTSNSMGYVSRLTLAQLRKMNFGGSPICTLEEALNYLSGTNAKLLMEIKVSGIEQQCVELTQKYGMRDRVTYISFSLNVLAAVRTAQADARIGFLYIANLKNPAVVAANYNIDIMLPNMGLVDEAYVAALHNANIEIGVWTVDKASDLRRMHRAGVDVIITDYVLSGLKAVGR